MNSLKIFTFLLCVSVSLWRIRFLSFYICDAVMDGISVALSREYIKTFRDIMHHNVDKGLLVAGGVSKGFGGGEMIKPMELIIGDRATREAGGNKIEIGR